MSSKRHQHCAYCGRPCYGHTSCMEHRALAAQERNLARYGTLTRPNDKDVAAAIEEDWRFGNDSRSSHARPLDDVGGRA